MLKINTLSFSEKMPIPSEKHIDIFSFSLGSFIEKTAYFLNESEIKRANRLQFSHHKRRFMVAHTMLRIILAKYLKTTPKQLYFTTETHGKPILKMQKKLPFNLSHSGERALIAIGDKWPIGVDIEQHSQRQYLELAEHYFSINEQAFLKKHIEEKQKIAFFKIWSRKEAFIKANGQGLRYPLETFDTSNFACPAIKDHQTNQIWHLLSFKIKDAYEAALCYHPTIQKINLINVNTTEWQEEALTAFFE